MSFIKNIIKSTTKIIFCDLKIANFSTSLEKKTGLVKTIIIKFTTRCPGKQKCIETSTDHPQNVRGPLAICVSQVGRVLYNGRIFGEL